jgi:NAD(P)H dehydrogenase (quinone)
MSDQKIFVAGATGDTGGAATEALLAAGEKVRTLVRKEDQRSERLKSRGVEVLVGDLSSLDDVARALEGIFSAYFVYPIETGERLFCSGGPGGWSQRDREHVANFRSQERNESRRT